jgi:ATP-dependent Lon protease
VQSLKLPDGNTKVLVEGIERARILQMSDEDGYIQATLRLSPFRSQSFTGYDTLAARLTQQFEQYIKLTQNSNAEQLLTAIRVDEIGRLADIICANIVLSIEEKQELVEIFNPVERGKKLVDVLEIEPGKVEERAQYAQDLPRRPRLSQRQRGTTAESIVPRRWRLRPNHRHSNRHIRWRPAEPIHAAF